MNSHALKCLIVLTGFSYLQNSSIQGAGRTYMVSTTGDETNTGTTQKKALGTIRKATEMAGPDIGALEFGEANNYLDGLSTIPPFPANYDPDTWPFNAPEPDK